MRNNKLKVMILTALFAAITAICAQISITFVPPVPFTLQTMAVALAAVILGRNGGLAILLYLIIGILGAPVFSKFSAGFPVIVGPTGGIPYRIHISCLCNGFPYGPHKTYFYKSITH